MSGGRKSRTGDVRRSSGRNMPTILGRKRKSEEEESAQPDIQNYFNVIPKSADMSVPSPQTNIIRPSSSSRVPLATISPQTNMPLSVLNQNTPLRRGVPETSSGRRKQALKRPRMRESWNQFRAFIGQPVVEQARGPAPLPTFKWGDNQLMWDLMVKRETGTYTRIPAPTMQSKHQSIQPKMRAILLDWLIEVCEVYKMHRETFYLAVDFFDRYLGVTADPVPKNRLQLIGVTCLFVGAKLEEIYPPKLQEFAYVTDGACTEEEILAMELEILKSLNWSLSPMTPNSWMRTFMQILHTNKLPISMPGRRPSENADPGRGFTVPAYNGLPFTRVMQLMDLVMLDFGCLDYSYSVLATSALYHMEGERVALAVSGLTWQQIGKCVGWMSSFAFAIRERSPVQVKSFHGVAPEDCHHLQNHAIDLPLLERATSRLAALADGRLRESPDPSGQTKLVGLENTPQEGPGDIMYPPSAATGTSLPLTALGAVVQQPETQKLSLISIPN